eukprot:CAMPEP_0117688836 /NCGR_PEP_ID=MMETSP0804-20121206/24093_1 /TAXON_ID=1074897 /ORGANISM="Tetraselmis astigmatica, Strain CCMP880" /LENGTH=87 /DNA_ID=CAMNT_0005501417 /DNA_START=93 /DNA_END=356 /DNA_ORIENTATION=-
MAPAPSSAVPMRPRGTSASTAASMPLVEGMPSLTSFPHTLMDSPSSFACVSLVSMYPKDIQLQRMLNGPHSLAMVFVSPTTPIFAVL